MNMQYFKEKICPFAGREYAADWRIMKQKLKAPGESLWKRLALWRICLFILWKAQAAFRLIFLIKKHRNCGERMLW